MPKYKNTIRAISSRRVVREDELRYYLLNRKKSFEYEKLDLRKLSKSDLNLTKNFYFSNYKETIFSSWMLEQPFWGLFLDDKLVSSGGAIILDKIDKAANIGNFLTAPDHRGKGYGKIIVKALINDLISNEIKTFSLGTTRENIPACRLYESLGFKIIEQRVEMELAPTD